MIDDTYIIEKFWPNKISIYKRLLKSNSITKEELEYLNNRFDDSDSIEETLYRIKNNIEIRPTCKQCGGYVKYHKQKHFNEFCSKSCIMKQEHVQDKMRKTCLEKYGVEYAINNEKSRKKSKQAKQSKEYKEKLKNVFISKYGYETPLLIPEIKEKAQINSHTKEARQKAKETILCKYGVDSIFNLKENREKCIERLKSEEVRNKIESTNLERYGVKSILKLSEIRQKTNLCAHSKEATEKRINTNIERYGHGVNIEKIKDTWLSKYGVAHPRMLEKSKLHMSKIMSSEYMQKRRYDTIKKNKTFYSSKPEKEILNRLKEKFPDVIYQYRDKERYPFNCDYYIPSLDLFIELHFHWTHGKHPFDKDNIEDIEILNKLIEKGKEKEFYNGQIRTWTIRDVNKRETAKKNNLNWIAFYNEKEFEKWFEAQ